MTTQTPDVELKPIEKLHQRLLQIGGCSNGGCYVVKRTGMVTNGACHCLENRINATRVVAAYQDYVRSNEGIENCKPEVRR